jgi:curved DNA-binding protein CbpA
LAVTIGLPLCDTATFPRESSLSGEALLKVPNYYELLQINPNAEPDTVHRVYRFLAARFHPDNPDTGDADQFALLKQAYDVLSNPVTRAEYDMACTKEASDAAPLSSSVDFMDSMEGELNRRLAVLALLYFRRRSDSSHPQVSLFEVEARMGFPREYLEFTIWYLQKKAYIVRADNADFTLTAEGVDFVETQRANIPVLDRLLTSGNTPLSSNASSTPIIVPGGNAVPEGTSVQ